jgi:hypothetical protein
MVLSYLLASLCQNRGFSTYVIQSFVNLVDTHQERESLLGTDDEVSSKGDVVEGGFFRAGRLLWMASGQMACRHLAIAVCVICLL